MAEELKRFRYAPGDYVCICSFCKKKFPGDKRAKCCERCAKNFQGVRLAAIQEVRDILKNYQAHPIRAGIKFIDALVAGELLEITPEERDRDIRVTALQECREIAVNAPIATEMRDADKDVLRSKRDKVHAYSAGLCNASNHMRDQIQSLIDKEGSKET
jgi:hypothetical protein